MAASVTFGTRSEVTSRKGPDGLTAATIKCCLCGLDIQGGRSMCVSCLAKETDCTANLSKHEQLTQCRECFKWKAANRWLRVDLESPELLAICLKKIKNLGTAKGARLVDAKFVWTEEHSRRIVVRLTVESMEAATRKDVIRQQCDCEFTVNTMMCPECQSDTVDQTWRSVVQLRQNVAHRRTMYFLEQEIVKRRLAEKASDVKESPFGLDVYFNKHDHAVKFADACQTLVPIGNRTESKQLTGQDLQNNEFRFRHSISLEIVPICKHDLCIVSKPLRSSLFGGSKNGVVLVENVARNIHIRDITTGRTAELQAAKYFAHPFRAVASAKDMIEFMVLDIEDMNKDESTVLEVARMKDFGENDTRLFLTTFSKFALTHHVESGDIVLGYDLCAFETDEISDPASLPQAVLVKKKPENKSEKKRSERRRRKERGESKSVMDASEVQGDDDIADDAHEDELDEPESL